MSVLPTPCNCKQTVNVDDQPPVIESGVPINNSVIQTVHVHSPKITVIAVCITIVLMLVVGLVMFGRKEPAPARYHLTFVQPENNIKTVTQPITLTNWVNLTNTVTQTNFTIVPIKTARVESAVVNNANVSVSGVRWRVLGVNDGDIMQLNYQLDNKEPYNITGIELLMTCYDGNKKIILKQILMDGSVNEDTPLMAYSAKPGQLAIPFEYSSLVKDVIVKVSGVRFR